MRDRNTFLDVLRTLAVVSVVTCHISIFFRPSDALHAALSVGGHGVDLFFVLSGWLLGSQLLAEQDRTGGIDVRRFWLRRWLRTLPAYFAVLALVTAWEVRQRGWDRFEVCYLVFGQTYFSEMPYYGVSWSLCVEEHFYLLVAPALVLTRSRAGRWALVSLLFLPSVARWFGPDGYPMQTHLRYDQCGIGVLMAYVAQRRPDVWRRLSRRALWLAAVGVGVVGYAVAGRLNPGWGWLPPSPSVWAAAAATWVILGSTDFWRSRTGSVVTRYLAERSYALYLLHPEAIALVKRGFGDLPFAPGFVLTWAGSLLGAEILYRVVEQPFIRSREWFSWSRKEAVPAGPRPEPGPVATSPCSIPPL